jgi:hypothetical protein
VPPAPPLSLRTKLIITGSMALAIALLITVPWYIRKRRRETPVDVTATATKVAGGYAVEVKTEKGADVACDGDRHTAYDGTAHFDVSDAHLSVTPTKVDVFAYQGYGSSARQGRTFVTLSRDPRPATLKFDGGEYYGTNPCSGDFCSGKIKVDMTKGALALSATTDLGSTVTVDGQSFTVKSSYDTIDVDLKDRLADLPLSAMTKKGTSLTFAVSVKNEDGSEKKGSITISEVNVARIVSDKLARLGSGPVLFAGEGASTGGGAATGVYVDSMEILGKSEGKIRDIGIVAVDGKSSYESGGSCGPYDNYMYAPISIETREVVVYERRTGKKLGSQTFRGESTGCPFSIMFYNGSASVTYSVTGDSVKWFVQGFVH